MKESKEMATMYLVRATCECGGELKSTGELLRMYPPKHPHVCLKCGKRVLLDKVYPRFERKED